MITEPASAIKQEVLQLIDLQIETLRQDSLSSAFVASLGNNLGVLDSGIHGGPVANPLLSVQFEFSDTTGSL